MGFFEEGEGGQTCHELDAEIAVCRGENLILTKGLQSVHWKPFFGDKQDILDNGNSLGRGQY